MKAAALLMGFLAFAPYWALWYEHSSGLAQRHGDFRTAAACAERLEAVGGLLAKFVRLTPSQLRFDRREPGYWEVRLPRSGIVHRLRCVETPWGTVPLRPPEDPYAPP